MRKLLVSILLCLIYNFSFGQLENIPLITVFGEASTNIAPNQIILKIEIIKPLSTAQLQTMRIFKLFDKENTNIRFIGSQNTEFTESIELINKKDNTEIIKEFYVTINDVSKYTDVLLRLYNAGFYNITMWDARNTKLNELKQTTYLNAIVDAKNKANKLALALGQKIGNAHTVEEIAQPLFNAYSQYLVFPYESVQATVGQHYLHLPASITIVAKVKVSFDLIK